MSSPFPSHILIIGGTGRVGRQIINTALSRGHLITALVRKPNTIPPHAHLTQIVGNPTSTPDILQALTSFPPIPITIISTLGQTRTNPSNPWSTPTSPPLLLTTALTALVSALRSSPVTISKLIVLSMFGTGASRPYLHWSLRWVMTHSAMRQTLEDHEGVNDVMLANFNTSDTNKNVDDKLDVPFLVVRCPMLTFDDVAEDQPVAEVRELGDGQSGLGMMTKITVSSLSRFIVNRVGDDGRMDRRMPVIAN